MASRGALQQVLGDIRARISSHKAERQRLIKDLSELIVDAQRLVADLGGGVASGDGRRKAAPVRVAGAALGRDGAAVTQRKRRKLSAAARDRIRQAQLKRWAKFRAAAK